MENSIENRKIEIISKLAQIEDENIILKIEELLNDEKYYTTEINSISIAEDPEIKYLIGQVLEKSLEDIKNGNVISHEDMLKEMEKWDEE